MRLVRGWHPVNALGAKYLLVFTVATGVCLFLGTTRISSGEAIVGTLVAIASLITGMLLTRPGYPPRLFSFLLAYLVSLVLVFFAVTGFWSTVLAHRGVRVTATVIGVRDGDGKGRDLRYTLAGPDGKRIPGELGWWPGAVAGRSGNPEGVLGAQVSVLMDPAGLVDPRLPTEVADHNVNVFLTILLYLATAGLCMVAGRPVSDRVRERGAGPRALRGSHAKRTAAALQERARADRTERQRRWQRRHRSAAAPAVSQPGTGPGSGSGPRPSRSDR
jgi:hypothetical protein